MSEQSGPERRRAPRHRSGKPYAKAAKATAAAPRSSFSSLLSIFTAPFKRATSAAADLPSGAAEQSESGSDSEDTPDSSGEIERQLRATEIGADERPDASSSTIAGAAGKAKEVEPVGVLPKFPPGLFQPTQSASEHNRPRWARGFGAPQPVSSSQSSTGTSNGPSFAPRDTRSLGGGSAQLLENPFIRTASQNPPLQPLQLSTSTAASSPSPQEGSPYKEIVDFLHTKRDDKLNQMEIIGLTQSLRKNATQPAQEMIDYLEAAANVPSAALLGTFKPSTSGTSSPNKPLLFPTPTDSPASPANASPSRARRRRNIYTGVGQSPRVIAGSPARASQPTHSRLRLQQPQPASEGPATTSNKKRLVGDSAVPIPSGSAAQTAVSSASTAQNDAAPSASTSSVPFPLSSPAKPQRAAPPTNAGPSSRPTMNGSTNGPFGTGRRAPLTRPEAPRHPSPLRKSNLDLSISSTDSDVDDSFEQKRTAPRKSDPKSRSQTSAAILDIIMDEANPLPPVKPKAASELKNPFEDMHPTPPRVSTPVRRMPGRLSRPWTASPSPAATPAPPSHKRGIESDNILDQIDSTAPKQSPPKKSKQEDTNLGDLPGVVNPFATANNPFGAAPPTAAAAASGSQRMKSPPISAFRATPDPSIASKVFAPGAPTEAQQPDAKQPSIQSFFAPSGASNAAKGKNVAPPPTPFVKPAKSADAPKQQKAPASSWPPKKPSAPAPPAKKQVQEIVVSDDSDEDEIVVVKPSKKGSNKFSAGDDDIEVDEVEEEEDEEDYENEEPDGSEDHAMRSATPSPVTSPSKHAQQATSVEEVDQLSSKSKDSTARNGGSSSRYGGTLNIPAAVHAPFKTSSPVVPSPLRNVSIPPSDGEDELSDTEDEGDGKPDALHGTTKVGSLSGTSSKIAAPAFPLPAASAQPRPQSISGPSASLTPKEKAQARAKQVPLKDLTVYEVISRNQLSSLRAESSAPSGVSEAASARAKAAVLALPASSLPKFDLFASVLVKPVVPSTSSSSKGPSPPMSAASSNGGFNWAAAGMAPPRSSTTRWSCPTCMVSNNASASQCAACETQKPASASGSGTSSPRAPGSGAATPANVTSPPPPPPAAVGGGGFNWAAAGMAPPTNGTSSSQWSCPTCMVNNPLTASKCQACEEPQPKAKTATTTPAASAPASSAPSPASSGGFNWAAAGMAPPTASSANWTCPTCMCSNNASTTQCPACETQKP